MRELYRSLTALLEEQHITPAPVKELAITPMWAVAGGEGQCGLAFRFGKDHSVYGPQPPAQEFLQSLSGMVGQPLTRLAEQLLDKEDLYSRALCLAALNALSAPLNAPDQLERRGWKPKEPGVLSFLRPEDKVVCIGYGYLIDQVLAVCPEVHVSDMRPRAAMNSYILGSTGIPETEPRRVIFHGAEENEALLADADVVLMTGCTLVNGTWQELMRFASKARVLGVFGPSAALPPEMIRDMGFHYQTTSLVTDGAQIFRNLRRPLTDPFWGNTSWRYSLNL